VTAEELVLAATAFLSGLASGLLGMLSTIMRPMLAAMSGRDFRNFMEAFLRYAGHSWGKVYNFAWSIGMTIGPIVALVFLVRSVREKAVRDSARLHWSPANYPPPPPGVEKYERSQPADIVSASAR